MDYYYCALESLDYGRIDKLNKLKNAKTFYDDVRKYTKNIVSDHAIGRWQCLAEVRKKELDTGMEKYISRICYDNDGRRYYEVSERPLDL